MRVTFASTEDRAAQAGLALVKNDRGGYYLGPKPGPFRWYRSLTEVNARLAEPFNVRHEDKSWEDQ